jgi:Uma2 family endonuclease
MDSSVRRRATAPDLLAIPEDRRFHEIIAGELVQKAAPTFEHGDAQSSVVARLKPSFQGPSGGDGRGGWWIATEVEIELADDEVYRPDVVGWRRDRVTERPSGQPVRTLPDWVCEIVSPSRPSDDTVKKLRGYQRAGVPHYWLLDLRDETLTVLRLSSAGYVVVLKAERDELVEPEPFAAMAMRVGDLFGG